MKERAYTKFGALVSYLRKERAGIWGQAWTQQQLGEASGLGYAVIADIEQGRRRPSPEVLVRLVNAFQLSLAEQREFYLAAADDSPDQRLLSADDSAAMPDEVLNVCRSTQLPACVQNDLGDLVAINGPFVALTGVSPTSLTDTNRFSAAKYSSARLVFDSKLGYCRQLGSSWSAVSAAFIRFFRATTLANRTRPCMQARLDELQSIPSFSLALLTRTSRDEPVDEIALCTQRWLSDEPALNYVWSATPYFWTRGTLYFVAALPQDSRTVDLLTRLANTAPAGVHRLAD